MLLWAKNFQNSSSLIWEAFVMASGPVQSPEDDPVKSSDLKNLLEYLGQELDV